MLGAVLPLAACANTAGLNATLDTLAKNYAHCERTLHVTAQAGPMSPASGIVVQGDLHCPALPLWPTGEPLPHPEP